MLIREGQYALALLEAPATVRNCRITRTVDVQGDLLPGATRFIILDAILLVAGICPPGLIVGQVVEE